MKLPNWAKITWWIFLVALIGLWFLLRREDLVAGRATPADVVIFLVWIALCLIPFFQEIKLFGLEFSQEIRELESHIDGELRILKNEIRSDIHNSVDVRPQTNIYNAPPPDAQLPSREKSIIETINEILQKRGTEARPQDTIGPVNNDLSFAMFARYNIERELRRLASKIVDTADRRLPISRLTDLLVRNQILDRRLADAIREVYSVCSLAVHAEDLNEVQIKFVRETAPGLIEALRSIR